MTDQSPSQTLCLIRIGVATGLATCVVYPALIFLPVPKVVGVTVAAAWGPLLGVACIGLGRLLHVEQRSVPAQLAVVFNFAAGVLVTAMLLVQAAVTARAPAGTCANVPPELAAVWAGLNVAWDVYLAVGTMLFALAMRRHARFGLAFALPGSVIALILLVFSIRSFPTPPANAGLFDPGSLVGLWYLAVTIQMWRSIGWAAAALGRPR